MQIDRIWFYCPRSWIGCLCDPIIVTSDRRKVLTSSLRAKGKPVPVYEMQLFFLTWMDMCVPCRMDVTSNRIAPPLLQEKTDKVPNPPSPPEEWLFWYEWRRTPHPEVGGSILRERGTLHRPHGNLVWNETCLCINGMSKNFQSEMNETSSNHSIRHPLKRA